MRRDLHADDVGAAFGEVGVDLCLGEVAMGAVVAWRELGGDLALAQVFELFGCFEGAVGGAVGEEDFDVLAVDFGAFGLAIGAVGAADVGAFVPVEAEPVEGVEDHPARRWRRSGRGRCPRCGGRICRCAGGRRGS